MHHGRYFIFGKALCGEAAELRKLKAFAFIHDNCRDHHLAPFLIRQAEYGDLIDIVMVVKRAFHFGRIDVFAAGNNHVFQAVADEQKPVFIEISNIAAVKPPQFVNGLGRRFGPVPISLHDIRPLNANLAAFSGGHGLIVLVHNANRGKGEVLPRRASSFQSMFACQHTDVRRRFGQPIALLQRNAALLIGFQ